MIDACESCLRRSGLVGFLAADVQALIPRGAPARAEAFGVGTGELLASLGPARAERARRFLGAFSARAARARVAGAGLDAVCLHAERFPSPLHELMHPPPVLYASGLARLGCGEPAAAVIGSRRPSQYGRTVAYALARGVAAAGVPVVSGLALGIDAVAHRGSLDAGGLTVAVLASGADRAYPRTNRALYEQIRASGVVVSEMPPGARPHRWLFPARNRIMAALAQATVVVEATERSGTLITAGYAGDLGRVVAAVPGWVTADAAAGTNGLLRDGAAVVTGPQDVLDLLYGVGARTVPEAPREEALAPDEARVLALVRRGGSIEDAGRELEVAARELRAILARLELAGLVRRTAAGAYLPAG